MAVNLMIKGPTFRTAQQLVADGTFPISQAMLLKLAKQHGIGRLAGRTIVFSAEDITKLYEALPCPSNSSSAPNPPIGSCAAPSVDKASKKLQALLTKKPQKPSASKEKRSF